jgi:hypothetical protein
VVLPIYKISRTYQCGGDLSLAGSRNRPTNYAPTGAYPTAAPHGRLDLVYPNRTRLDLGAVFETRSAVDGDGTDDALAFEESVLRANDGFCLGGVREKRGHVMCFVERCIGFAEARRYGQAVGR